MAKKPLKRKKRKLPKAIRRPKRKLPKAKLPAGFSEDEFGELKRKLQPKRSRKPSTAFLRQAEAGILDRMVQQAKFEIFEQEDARVFVDMDSAFMTDEERLLLEKLKIKLKAAAADLLRQFETRIDLEVGFVMTDFWAQRKTKRRGKKPGVR